MDLLGSTAFPQEDANQYDTDYSKDVALSGRSDLKKFTPKLENSYQMEPKKTFDMAKVTDLADVVLKEYLTDLEYEPNMCKAICQDIAAVIMERAKSLKVPRYKIVAVVSIGSLQEKPAIQFASRCLWNDKTDTSTTVRYSNKSLYAVALIYALYYE